jgi:chaperone modulatory protein CbpM
MGSEERSALSGLVLSEEVRLSVHEICSVCDVERDALIEMVMEGLVEPVDLGLHPREWRFSGTTVTRIRTAQRLQRDLGVNLSGAALALELLEEIDRLRRWCRRFGGD